MGATVLFVVAGLCLVTAIWLWWSERPHCRERPGAAPGPGPVPMPAPVPPPAPAGAPAPVLVPDRRATDERRRLVELCIELSDRLAEENVALAGRLHRGLAEVGVQVVEPDGSLFDRREHDALDVEPAPSPRQVRIVASTARSGFVDRGEVLRRPGVVVYTSEDRRDD